MIKLSTADPAFTSIMMRLGDFSLATNSGMVSAPKMLLPGKRCFKEKCVKWVTSRTFGLVCQKVVEFFNGSVERHHGKAVISHVQDQVLAHYSQANQANVSFSEKKKSYIISNKSLIYGKKYQMAVLQGTFGHMLACTASRFEAARLMYVSKMMTHPF